MEYQVTLDDVTAIMVGVIVALLFIHFWVNGHIFARPTIDDVMKKPAAFFHNSEWDPVVGRLVAEVARDRVEEIYGPMWTIVQLTAQESHVWQVLNERLLQEKENA